MRARHEGQEGWIEIRENAPEAVLGPPEIGETALRRIWLEAHSVQDVAERSTLDGTVRPADVILRREHIPVEVAGIAPCEGLQVSDQPLCNRPRHPQRPSDIGRQHAWLSVDL